MYKRILVPLEHSRWDSVILKHVRDLSRHTSAELLLIHVADGFAARNVAQLDLRESEEMRKDRAYLDECAAALIAEGFKAEALLCCGDPSNEIALAADREACDLIAMATHGHKFLADLIHGSVASAVRHKTMVPVLMVRGNPDELGA